MSRLTQRRKLRFESLECRAVLAVQSWNLAADFASDFVGGLPQDNSNGVWTYLGTDGTAGSLVKTNGSSPNTFGVGAGWADASGVPSYARGGVFGFPSQTMAGHGPNRIVFTAPETVDLGGVQLRGLFTQASFAPDRQMQMRIYKNDSSLPFLTVNANFQTQNTIVPLPETRIALAPGDTLTIDVDGLGPLGNSVSTFAAWNVIIDEFQLPGDYNFNGVVDAADYTIWRDNLAAVGAPGMVAGDGTSSGNLAGAPDGIVDAWDYQFWYQQFGNQLDSGVRTFSYHPAAIIVQTTGVTLPDGTLLDINDSLTQGLQEAFDYSAAQGWDVFVLPGTYALDAHLDVEELQLRTFRLEDVTLNFSSSVTDFGIRFDSTMQVDWYWDGGALNAASAAHGLLFAPHTPHPKDGPIYNTVGVVDSRFEFDIDIVAAGHKVTMDTTQSAVNDTVLSFRDQQRSQVNFIGHAFTETNIFSAGRDDDSIAFDLFSPAGRVTVLPPANQYGVAGPGAFATVIKPDGSLLSTTESTTSGLQEAFDYAKAMNVDVVVFGRGVRNANPNTSFGHYTLNSSLVVGDLVNRRYKIYGVTFLYPGSGGTAMRLAGLVNSDFELTGEVVGYNSDIVVHIKPELLGITNSFVRIQHPVGMTNSVEVNVLIDPRLQSIDHTEFYFHEVNEGQYGIRVDNPSAGTFFQHNFIRTVHNHATNQVAVQLGQSQTNASNIRMNTLEVRTAAALYPSHSALQVWGDFNAIDLIAVGATHTFGAKFEPGSNNNILIYGTLNATTPIADFGIDNRYIPRGEGALGGIDGADTLFVAAGSTPRRIDRANNAVASTQIAMPLVKQSGRQLRLAFVTEMPKSAEAKLIDGVSFLPHMEPVSPSTENRRALDLIFDDWIPDPLFRALDEWFGLEVVQ